MSLTAPGEDSVKCEISELLMIQSAPVPRPGEPLYCSVSGNIWPSWISHTVEILHLKPSFFTGRVPEVCLCFTEFLTPRCYWLYIFLSFSQQLTASVLPLSCKMPHSLCSKPPGAAVLPPRKNEGKPTKLDENTHAIFCAVRTKFPFPSPAREAQNAYQHPRKKKRRT